MALSRGFNIRGPTDWASLGVYTSTALFGCHQRRDRGRIRRAEVATDTLAASRPPLLSAQGSEALAECHSCPSSLWPVHTGRTKGSNNVPSSSESSPTELQSLEFREISDSLIYCRPIVTPPYLRTQLFSPCPIATSFILRAVRCTSLYY